MGTFFRSVCEAVRADGRGRACPENYGGSDVYGPYGEIGPLYEQLTKFISEKGCEPTGVVYEYYYNSPGEIPESELLTKVEFLLR